VVQAHQERHARIYSGSISSNHNRRRTARSAFYPNGYETGPRKSAVGLQDRHAYAAHFRRNMQEASSRYAEMTKKVTLHELLEIRSRVSAI